MDNGDLQHETDSDLRPPVRAVTSPRRIFWAQCGVMARNWARDTFSVASLLAGLRSLIWIAPLSVLIWIYAERELQANRTEIFTVSIRSPDPSRVIRLKDPPDGRVRADLSGPQGRLEQVHEQLETGQMMLQIDVPDAQLSPGPHQILTSLVENDPKLVRNGITIANCVPREITVYVDKLEDVELDVQAPADMKNLVAPPVFEPRKVNITAPHSVFEDARASGRLAAYAKIDAVPGSQTPGTHDLSSVAVVVPFTDPNLKVTPLTVSAHYDVRKSDASMVISSMPIWVVWPPGMAEQYKAEYEPSLANVRVSGPEEVIRQLKDPDFKFKPKAMFEVSTADLPPDTLHERLLKFDLPPDVHVSPDDAKRTVQFKLIERRGAE